MNNYEYEDCSFLSGTFYTIYGFVVVIVGFTLMLWFSSWFLKPDDYTPSKNEEIKVEQVKSTEPVINHDVTVETNITVSDGVTKRTMKSKVKTEEVTHDVIKTVNDQMLQATYKIVDDRQREINSDPNYWNKNIINHTKEH